jgi:FixJ family two-component response regulator
MNSTQPIVRVVDDDASFRSAISRLLRAGGYAVQTFTSAAEFLERLDPHTPGCVLADLRMPGQSGLDLQALLAKADNPTPVIFLTGHGDIPTTVRAMRQGAVDFLTKPVQKQKLFDSVKRALARNAREREQRAHLRALGDRLDTLTPREREVVAHVVSGKLNKQIAADLGTTERTIKAHRAGIMKKLAVQSVAELVRLAQELGIQPVP